MRTALYPGCSLEGSSAAYKASLRKALAALDVNVPVLENWTCCGATSAHAMNHDLFLALCLRNLALAEEQGCSEILAPCAACFHRLTIAAKTFRKDSGVLREFNEATGLSYGGSVAIRNVIDLFANVIGTEAIAARVKTRLSPVTAVCYYGCLNTRTPRIRPFDDRENPTAMERVAEALGARALDWRHKTECCGASLFVTSPRQSRELISGILADARELRADCILTACPMCQSNLDAQQREIPSAPNAPRPVPVLFFTQLAGLALGISPDELKMDHCFVPFPWK